jgi:competence protein ComEC
MVRVTLCLVAGILVAIHLPGSLQIQTAIVLMGGSAVVFIAAFCFKSKVVTGFSGMTIIVLLGGLLVSQRTPRNNSAHLIHQAEEVLAYQAVVTSYLEERKSSYRTRAEVNAVFTETGWNPVVGTVALYIPLRDSVVYQYGDLLLVNGSPKKIPGPSNPGEFDFRRLMEYKGIYYQDWIPAERVRVIANEPPNRFLSAAIKVRLWADRCIRSAVHGAREQATASALVLGVTDGLDQELLQAYASTGALHVLAVSGLHVSIIYWILLLILKPLDRPGASKWCLALISVFLLWSYAFISGWSPSVLRAVMMFTFVAFARPWRQSTNIFNTLASSMFCLLLYDPYFIMSVGFQLSYLAVFGIVWLQPRLYGLWEPRARLWDEIWKVSSVSLAAQIATLPIGFYYFHQFPNYFLAANLAIIPISFVVLVLGLAIPAFSFFGPLVEVLGWLLTWTIWCMNTIVIAFERLPYSVIANIYITKVECIVLAAFIGSIVLLFIRKDFGWLMLTVTFACTLSLSMWLRQSENWRYATVRVYNINGLSVIDHILDGHSTLVADSVRLSPGTVDFYIRPAWLRDGVRESAFMQQQRVADVRGHKAWLWNGIAVLQITQRGPGLPDGSFRFVVISNNSLATLDDLSGVKCEKIIVDSSNSPYFAERLRAEAVCMGWQLWSVHHDGAFEFKHVLLR